MYNQVTWKSGLSGILFEGNFLDKSLFPSFSMVAMLIVQLLQICLLVLLHYYRCSGPECPWAPGSLPSSACLSKIYIIKDTGQVEITLVICLHINTNTEYKRCILYILSEVICRAWLTSWSGMQGCCSMTWDITHYWNDFIDMQWLRHIAPSRSAEVPVGCLLFHCSPQGDMDSTTLCLDAVMLSLQRTKKPLPLIWSSVVKWGVLCECSSAN